MYMEEINENLTPQQRACRKYYYKNQEKILLQKANYYHKKTLNKINKKKKYYFNKDTNSVELLV